MSYPPPPDQQQYTSLYPVATSEQLLGASHTEQVSYNVATTQAALQQFEQELGDGSFGADPSRNDAAALIESNNRANRLRKACDSCSIRKVKCDENGPPCRACAQLDIPCTFQRPSRRRGPPNKHAEALKKRRFGSPSRVLEDESNHSSPTHAAQALAALSTQPALSAESIYPSDVLELLVDDFFTYVYPLSPFPHEPSFREAWRRREDYNNGPFLALFASMMAVLVATAPLRHGAHLRARAKSDQYPSHVALVQKCQHISTLARGSAYLERDDINIYDAATSYFLGLSAAYTSQLRRCRLYLGECWTVVQMLECAKDSPGSFHDIAVDRPRPGDGTDADEAVVDKITQQMSRRVYWSLLASVSTLKQLVVTAFDVFVLPSGIDAGTAHPLLPAEVDDVHIYPDHIGSQPADVASVIAGFNANITITLAHSALESADFAKDAKDEHGYGRRQLALDSTFRTCESALEKLPKELLIQGEANGGTALRDYSNGRINLDGDDDESSATARHAKLQERRRQQFDIQQINIHLGHLAAKLHALDRCRSLCERHGAAKALSPSNHAGPATPISARESDIEEAEFYKYLIKERERAVNESIAVLNGIETIAAELQISTTWISMQLILTKLTNEATHADDSAASVAEKYLVGRLEELLRLEQSDAPDADSHSGD